MCRSRNRRRVDGKGYHALHLQQSGSTSSSGASCSRERLPVASSGWDRAVERAEVVLEAVVEQYAEVVLGRYYRVARSGTEWHLH